MSSELGEVRQAWERLGSIDPYWAVLTEHDHSGDSAHAGFFERGRQEVQWVLDLLAQHDKRLGDVAVDFGCGVGRLSIALAEHVHTVVGIDVAASMLDEARANNPHGPRVQFVHNDASTLPFDDDSVDFVLSLITLQHIPPRLSLRYLLEMIRVVRPGGHLAVQLPSHMPMPQPIPEQFCRGELTVLDAPSEATADEALHVELSVRNAGEGPWPSGQLLNVANHWHRDGEVIRRDDGRASVPALRPGESATVSLRVTTPLEPGEYELEFDLVQEHVVWWEELGNPTARIPLTVTGSADLPVASDEPEPNKNMQMHGIHTDLVRGLFDQLGCRVLEAVPDDLAKGWVSYLYVVEVGEYELKLRS